MTLTEPVRTEQYRQATAAIDGVIAMRICRPTDPQELADLLRDASNDDASVYPVGNGLHQRFGATPERVDLAVSTTGLSGILRYDPEDLVVSVRAGTTLAEVQAELATNGQWLPVEAPGGSRATIGGMLALGLTGPRQLGSLSMRDLLLGMSVALTDGTVAKSGGMVVKNVTGFDMGRLHVGANGTLGVIASANFKVLPRPETEATLIAGFDPGAAGITAAFEAFGRLRTSPLRAVAADIVIGPDAVRLAIRFEGRSAAVHRQKSSATDLIGGDQRFLSDPVESRDWWERHVEHLAFASPERTMFRLDARTREMSDAVATVTAAFNDIPVDEWRVAVSPGLGSARIDIGRTSQQHLAAIVVAMGDVATSLTVLGAPPKWKAALLPPRPADPRAIDQALRDQFDPKQILNRGRFPIPSTRSI